MAYWELRTRIVIEGEQGDEWFESFDGKADAGEELEGMRRRGGLVDILHEAIVAEAGYLDPSDGVSYGEETYAESELYYGEEGCNDGELVGSARVGAADVFELFGRTGCAWKVEVVTRDAGGEVTDVAESFWVYPGHIDPVDAGREALSRAAREHLGRDGCAEVELYVTACVEVDDDGGDGEGEVVLHETMTGKDK